MPITTEEPKVNLNGKYPIGKAAKILGISRQWLKKLTDEERVINCKYGKGKKKFFTGREILRFWQTY